MSEREQIAEELGMECGQAEPAVKEIELTPDLLAWLEGGIG